MSFLINISILKSTKIIEKHIGFEDIANAVYYFGSDMSKNTTGAELTVDGGNMIQLYPIINK